MKSKSLWISLLCVSLLFGFPHLVGLIRNHPYVPTVVVGVVPISFDENHYAVRIYKSYASGNFVSDAYAYEYRKGPFVLPTISTFILGRMARFFGGVQNLFIWADFIFPPLLFLAIFYFAKRLFIRPLWALAAAWVVILSDLVISLTHIFFQVLQNFSFVPLTQFFKTTFVPLFYSRLENPQFTSIFLFLTLTLFYDFLVEKSSWFKAFVLSAAVLVLVYSYPYFGIFVLVSFVAIGVIQLLRRKQIKHWLCSGIIIGIGCLPYILNLGRFYQLAHSADVFARWGQQTQLPSIPPVPLITILLLIFSLWFVKRKSPIFFLILAMIIALCCPFIFRVQAAHFISRILEPIHTLAKVFLVYLFIQRFKVEHAREALGLSLFIFGVVVIGIVYVLFYTNNSISAFTLSEERLSAYQWVSNNIPDESVVLSLSLQTNYQLPAFAYTYNFLPYGALSLIPSDEIQQRIFAAYKGLGVSQEVIRKQFGLIKAANRTRYTIETIETIGGYTYFTEQVRNKDNGTWGLDEQRLATFLNDYNELKAPSLAELKTKYKIDYLFWGPFEQANAQLPKSGIEKIFGNEIISIYKIL